MPDALIGLTLRMVEGVRQQGRGRIGTVRGHLDRRTQGARGKQEAADDVKEW